MAETNYPTREDVIRVDLDKQKLVRGSGLKLLGMDDQLGDLIGIRAFKDGEPFDLTGYQCQGYFIRANGSTVVMTGTVSDNWAGVWLAQACYAYEGQFALAIKLVHSSYNVTETIRIVDGVVTKTTTDTIIDPGSVVPDLAQLLAQIEACEDATEAANDAATNATNATSYIAPTYSTSSAYAVGDYAIYNGNLYRCTTAISSGEAWTSSHWTQVKTMGEIIDVKSVINESEFNVNTDYVIGQYVFYNGKHYRFIAPHTSGVAWNVNTVVEVSVDDELVFINDTIRKIDTGDEVLTSSDIYTSDGFHTYGGWKSTDYLPVGEILRIEELIAPTFNTPAIYTYAFFDENKTFISGLTGGSTYGQSLATFRNIPIPETAKYIRYVGRTGGNYSYNKTKLTYLMRVSAFVDNIQSKMETDNELEYKGEDCLTSENIYTSTGFHTYGGWKSTDYISLNGVKEISKITVPTFGTSIILYSYAFFNENFEFVDGIYGGSTYGETLVTFEHVSIPATAKYIRFIGRDRNGYSLSDTNATFSIDIIKQLQFHNASIAEIEKKADSLKKTANVNKYFFDNVLCIGDSLTAGDYGSDPAGTVNVHKENYPYYYTKITGTPTTNKGICGLSCVGAWQEIQNGLIDTSVDYDAIYIYLGTNLGIDGDMETTAPGLDYRNYDTTTSSGAYCAIVSWLKEQYPDAHIYLINLSYNSLTPDLTELRSERIGLIANKFDVPVIDIMTRSPFTRTNGDIYRPIGYDAITNPYGNLHFGRYGYLILAKTIVELTSEIIDNNIYDYVLH